VIHSWWSDSRSFTIAPGPDSGIKIIAPESGATNVGRTNLAFSWSPVASADKYDWVLSPNPDLSAPVDQKLGLNTTACTYTGTALAYGTPYYWQVKAYNKEGSVINKSTIGSFTTAAVGAYCCPQCGLCFDTQALLQAHANEAHGGAGATPFWVWVIIAIGAVLVIVVIVLIFRTRRV
jgi:hypothetical protein